METLRCCGHSGFPVTPDVRKAFDLAEPFDLHGIVLRETLLKMIHYRIGFFEPDASGEIPSSRSHVPAAQKVVMPCRHACVLNICMHCHLALGEAVNHTQAYPAMIFQPVHLLTLCLQTALLVHA